MVRIDLVAVTSFVLAACGWHVRTIAPSRAIEPVRPVELPQRPPRRKIRRAPVSRLRSLRGRHH